MTTNQLSPDVVTAKVVLLGESGVGKSALVLRFVCRDYHADKITPVGGPFLAPILQVPANEGGGGRIGGGSVKFEIWDTAGMERYGSLPPAYFHGARAALVVYDITSEDSFHKALHWVQALRHHCGGCDDPNGIAIALVGSKCDLGPLRAVSQKEAQRVADEEGLLGVFETSAKDGRNVDIMMQALASKIIASSERAQQQQQQQHEASAKPIALMDAHRERQYGEEEKKKKKEMKRCSYC